MPHIEDLTVTAIDGLTVHFKSSHGGNFQYTFATKEELEKKLKNYLTSKKDITCGVEGNKLVKIGLSECPFEPAKEDKFNQPRESQPGE